MMKPTARHELLAEYYLRHDAGGAAVWIDAEGHVGAQDVASIETGPDRTVYCCARGVHFTLVYRLYEWKKALKVDQHQIAASSRNWPSAAALGSRRTRSPSSGP